MTIERSLIASIAVTELAGLLGVPATRDAMKSGWYDGLRKPSFAPPEYVYGPAWTLLYGLQGYALRELWRRRDTPDGRRALVAFATQLALNVAWSKVFFGHRSTRGGLVTAVALLAAVAWTIERSRRVSSGAAAAMLPNAAWVGFATAVTGAIDYLEHGGRAIESQRGRVAGPTLPG
ncbi:MAG: tryptophan-rich sensory protein [Steroidobacteraceae bacterium]|jgi:tryptophan-rich sensory protein|nr:tryptophan-rich sensory protein [Steroidobacteraceae bacterium]